MGQTPEEFQRMKIRLHGLLLLSPKERRAYLSRKQQLALWEKGIAEASWAINKRPYATTEHSCGGHTDPTKRWTADPQNFYANHRPYIAGRVRTVQEYHALRRSAMKAGLVLKQKRKAKWSDKRSIIFIIKARKRKKVTAVTIKESQARFRQFAKNLRRRKK